MRSGFLTRRRPAGVVTPTPWLDPALRLYTDAAGTTPSTADGDVIRNWTSSDGTPLTQASGTANTRQTVGGKPCVRSASTTTAGGLALSTASLPSVRPDKFDLLVFVTAAGLSTSVVPATTATTAQTVFFNAGSGVVLTAAWNRTASDGTGTMRAALTAGRVYSATSGTDTTLNLLGNLYAGGLEGGWSAFRFTLENHAWRVRGYTGSGAAVSDGSVAGANGDEVMSTTTTFPYSAMVASLYRCGFGRVYRNWGGVYSAAELAAIFSDAGYP